MSEIHFRGENGVQMYFSAAALPEAIARRLARGDLTRVCEDGTPWDDSAEDVEGTEDAADEPPPDAPPLPGLKENRGVWTEFAISQGMDRAEANAMTKQQLVAKFTQPAES